MKKRVIYVMVLFVALLSIPVFSNATGENNNNVVESPSKTIEDGEYEIRSALNSKEILDVDIASSRLQLWQDSDVYNQRFFIKYKGDGYYEITTRSPSKNLEVTDASTQAGATVCHNTKNNSNAQSWIIKDAGDGYYNIISKCNGYYMTVDGESAKNGSKILLFEGNGSENQKFKMDKVLKDTGIRTIEDGEYEIRSSLNNKEIMDIDVASSKLQLWQDSDVYNQRFNIKYKGDGYYQITLRSPAKDIEVEGSSIKSGAAVRFNTSNKSDAQSWIIKDAGDGYYNIISKCNGYYMTVDGESAKNGSKILLFEGNGNDSQKFKMDKVLKDTGKKTIEDGEYEIKSALNISKTMDIDVASAKLQLWEDSDVYNQRFNIKYKGDGYYQITLRRPEKNLEVDGPSIRSGTAVTYNTPKSIDAQSWIIKDAGDGYYNIISKFNGYYMTIDGSSAMNGSKIKLLESNGEYSQKFKLDKIHKETGTRTLADGEYEIKSILDETKTMDIDVASSKLQLWEDCDVYNQRFNVKYKGNGYYEITLRRPEKNLEVGGSSLKQGTTVSCYNKDNSDAQLWIIKETGDGYYNIISKCNGHYMTVEGDNAKNGSKIQLFENGGIESQKFSFTKFEKVEGVKSVENGEYEIRSAKNDRVIFDIDIASSKLQFWEDCNAKNQRFYITYLNNGYYKITLKQNGKALDISGSGLKNGADVEQYNYCESEQQTWIIKSVGNGYYNIISKASGYYMTAADANAKNGTKIKVYEKNGEETQKFKLERVNDTVGIDVSSHNGDIDWTQVKASGIGFAMIRVGYRGYETGKVVSDSKFKYNIENAIKNHIDVGVYFYSQAITEAEAVEEAKFVVSMIKNYKITCPVVIDSEFVNGDRVGRADWLSKTKRTAICKAFCKEIAKNGYEAMIYASKSWFYDELNFSELSNYSIWVAHYTYDPEKKTNFKYAYDIWQYTDSGKVPGIKGNVDLDIRCSR